MIEEDLLNRQGLFTHPQLVCKMCGASTPIDFAKAGESKPIAINRRSVLANKCVGGTHSSLAMFFAMMDLPPPLSRNIYSENLRVVCEKLNSAVTLSIGRACDEVRSQYNASPNETIDILVSCDRQKRGHSSLFGAVFVIAYETGKMLDYMAFSKYCAGCRQWERKDQTSEEYRAWKEAHSSHCMMNFSGSAGAMEPEGTLQIFKRSESHRIRYKNLISDGDSKSFSLLLQENVYGSGPDDAVVKRDCVGHVQKRLGTALRNLKSSYRGHKLSDGKTIGGAGRLTNARINSLQNY